MITLLGHLTSIEISTDGKLPSETDKTHGADIARIKYYRNYFAYLEDVKMNNTVFKDVWEDTCNVSLDLCHESQNKHRKTESKEKKNTVILGSSSKKPV